MSKLNYILEELIFESRRKDVIEKYRDRLTDTLNDNPTPINGMMEDDFDKVVEHIESELPHPKYLEFVLDNMCCGGYGLDTEQTLPLIQNFHRLAERNLIKNKDIYSKEYAKLQGSYYVDLSNLYDVVEKATELEISKERDKVLKGQKDVVYDGPRWRVIVPKTHKASCAYGSGTKWCTTSKDSSFFKQYTNDAILFYIIDKSSPTSEDNVMYKAALNWLFQWNEKTQKFSAKRIEDATLYDSADNTVRLNHVLPLLPEEMVMKIRTYYANAINKENEILKSNEVEDNLVFTKLQEEWVENGVVRDLMAKIQRDLPNEQVVRLNGGLSDLEVIPDTNSFWFSLNNFTGYDEIDEEHEDFMDNPLFSGYIFGGSQMSGEEQLIEIQLNDENGNQVDYNEVMMDFRNFYNLYGRGIMRGFPQEYENFKRNVASRKNLFVGLDKKKLVDYLYGKIISMLVAYSWKRKWDKGEQTYFDSGDKVFWVPGNSSSTFTFKYPQKENSTVNKLINYIKKNPGTTAKEYYKKVHNFDYYPGYNTQLWGSIKDSGILRTEKGPYGVLKYYIGPNYKKWTEGNLERYREQSRPIRWNR
ncbi:hypothetical protein N9966_00235 [bacterium]|nr:hypothetical protein [bacterium]